MLHNAAIFSQPKSLLMWFMFRLDPSLLYNPEFTGLVFMKILFEPYHNTSLYTFKRTLEMNEMRMQVEVLSPITPAQKHNV